MSLPDEWTHDAARLPVAFAQVREDPAVDAALLAEWGGAARVIMIASGGDTAAFLTARGAAASLHLVDVNPAQLALTRLKLHLLRRTPPAGRAAILGHRAMHVPDRAAALLAIGAEVQVHPETLGPSELLASAGPDQAGRYEILFARLRMSLSPRRSEVAALMRLGDPIEQARRVRPGSVLGAAMEAAFASTMRLENLVALFGAEATRNPAQDFSGHFAQRTRRALATFPARENSFLTQLLLDPPDAVLPDWASAPAPDVWPEIGYTQGDMVDALRNLPAGQAEFVGLSNILDWLSPEAARETLHLAWRALRPGGVALVRQLNSSLEIPPLGTQFHWEKERAAALHATDRSFFYRALHIARRPGP